MDYFLVKQLTPVSLPKGNSGEVGEASARLINSIAPLERLDFLALEALISDRLKLVLEQYLPHEDWQPCAFVDIKEQREKTFWFLPRLSYMPEQPIIASSGILASFLVRDEDFAKRSPGIFCIPNPKGAPFFTIHLSVAESILRRGICGFALERL